MTAVNGYEPGYEVWKRNMQAADRAVRKYPNAIITYEGTEDEGGGQFIDPDVVPERVRQHYTDVLCIGYFYGYTDRYERGE